VSTHNETTIWQNEWLTVKEVSLYLRLSRVTIWRWCQQGIIPAIQIGRNWRIHRDDLLRLSQIQNPTPNYEKTESKKPED
jgi:excisionase family DNA binding protein